jgi:hypothetical protein
MSKFCPACGSEETDDQSIFCRTCGNRFPANLPEKKSISHPAADHRSRSALAGGDAIPDDLRVKKGPRKRGNFRRFLSFDIFITKPAITVIYCIGAIVLTLGSVLYLVLGIVKPALLPTLPTQNPLVLTPLFWIALLIFGNLFWRIMCELLVVFFNVNESLVSMDNTLTTLNRPMNAEDLSEYTQCPLCSETVRIDELQKCDQCGVMGCKKCIRTAGLIKRKNTCKTCFEK